MHTIGEVSKRFAVPISTIRYYDKKGLLPFVKRNDNGEREFSDSDLGYIEVINCMKRIGLPIKKIKEFIDLCMEGDSTLDERLGYVTEQEIHVHNQICDLERQLKFIEWKKDYYTKAVAAGTEADVFGTHMPEELK